jgi:hypothetical protein
MSDKYPVTDLAAPEISARRDFGKEIPALNIKVCSTIPMKYIVAMGKS